MKNNTPTNNDINSNNNNHVTRTCRKIVIIKTGATYTLTKVCADHIALSLLLQEDVNNNGILIVTTESLINVIVEEEKR